MNKHFISIACFFRLCFSFFLVLLVGLQPASAANSKPNGCIAPGISVVQTFLFGYPNITWNSASIAGASVESDNVLKKTASWGYGNSGASSVETLAAGTDGYIEFTATYTNMARVIGLSEVNSDHNRNSADFAISLDANANLHVIYGGASHYIGKYVVNDEFRIERNGGVITFSKGGVHIGPSGLTSNSSLLVDVAMETPQATIDDLFASFAAPQIIPQTFYTISNGNWSDPSIWSLSQGGNSIGYIPTEIDQVIIDGHQVLVNAEVACVQIDIKPVGASKLEVSGTNAHLTVNGNIVIEGFTGTDKFLIVRGGGKIECK